MNKRASIFALQQKDSYLMSLFFFGPVLLDN